MKRSNKEIAEAYSKAEAERETLQARMQELGDLSFAKHGYVSTGPKGAGSINFDNASSIDRDSELGDAGDEMTAAEKTMLQQRVVTLEDEISKYRKQIEKSEKETKKALESSM